jgi:NAD+ kinase
MPEAAALAESIAAYLAQRNISEAHATLQDPSLRAGLQGGRFDLLVALGGDGTMLRAGHLCAPAGVPLLGINLGRLGYLIEIGRDEWPSALDRILAGEYWLENRMTLRADLRRQAQSKGSWDAINESVIGRGEMVRPVRLVVEIDGRRLTTYVADALIVATATGSTAYALAAGGPLLPPELRNILLVPVAPHLSVDRAIVLPEGASVRVTVRTSHGASLSVDGQTPVALQDEDQVEVRAGPNVVSFVRLQDPGYFYRNLTTSINHNPAAERER